MSRTPTPLSPTKSTSTVLPLRSSSAMPLSDFITRRTAASTSSFQRPSWSNASGDSTPSEASTTKDSTRNIFDASTNISISSLERGKKDLESLKLPMPALTRTSAKESPHYDQEEQEQYYEAEEEEEGEEKYDDAYDDEHMQEGYEGEETEEYQQQEGEEYQYPEGEKAEYEEYEEQYDEDGYLQQPSELPGTGDAANTATHSIWSDESVSITDRTYDQGFMARTPPRTTQKGKEREIPDINNLRQAQRRFAPLRQDSAPAAAPAPQRTARVASPVAQNRRYEELQRPVRPQTPEADKTIRPDTGPERRAQSASERLTVERQALPPPVQDTRNLSLLTDEELSTITDYSALLETLQDRNLNNQAAAPQNMELELENLVKYNYGNRDARAPAKFFAELPDAAYEEAGEVISAKKREIEEKLKEAARKRRKVVDEGAEEVRSVAEDTVKRLALLKEKREQLKGGVGLLLKQSGLAI